MLTNRYLGLASATLLLAACGSVMPPRGASSPRPSAAIPERAVAAPPTAAPSPTIPEVAADPGPAPDVVVRFDGRGGVLSPQMLERLRRLADTMREDERLIARLESYVPDGGSTSLDLGIAEAHVQEVRSRLAGFGVPARRLLSGAFGGEHGERRRREPGWVEIYLIRPGY